MAGTGSDDILPVAQTARVSLLFLAPQSGLVLSFERHNRAHDAVTLVAIGIKLAFQVTDVLNEMLLVRQHARTRPGFVGAEMDARLVRVCEHLIAMVTAPLFTHRRPDLLSSLRFAARKWPHVPP